MKTKEQKQKDLNALTEKLNSSKSAMVVSFNKVTVNKDQEFRHQLREAGASYQIVKNTIARLAVKGTPYEGASEYFKGVTAIAWTESDPVVLSKAVSKFVKANADFYTFKAGVVEGKVVNLQQVQEIASLPSKEELISKLLFVINAQAQRIVSVINAVPRNLAVVIKQIGDKAPETKAEQPKSEAQSETQETAAPEQTGEQTATEMPEMSETTDAPAAETVETQAEDAPEAEQNSENTAAPETSQEEPAAEEPKAE